MYFNTLPKTEKKDLFGVDYVLKNLIAALTDNSTRLIVIKGLRRVGKTSLLNVALNEAKVDFVKIDVREGNYYVREEFFNFLLRQIQPKTGNFLEKI